MAWRPCWMTKQKVVSSSMAATSLPFGSLRIGCKPPIISRVWIKIELSLFHSISASNISSRCPWCKLFSFVSYDGTKSPYTSKIKQNKEAFIINSINHGPSFPPDLVLTGKNGVSDIGKVYRAGKYAQGRPRSAYLAGSAEFQLSELEVYYRSSGKFLL